jgi:hypothetical protein
VTLRKLLGRILILGILQIGVYSGMRMPPEEIEKLLNVMTRTRVVHILRRERDKDDD